jgi:hypothetical protein
MNTALVVSLEADVIQVAVEYVVVPGLVSRICDVVLVRRIFSSGKPRGGREFGMGREWGGGWKGGGQFTSNLGPRWTGSYDDKEGFQVSKREVGLKQQGIGKGSKRQGDCAMIMLSICIHVYNNCLNVECS